MPLRFSATPGPALEASPAFGAHARDLLAELGFDEQESDQLVARAVVADGPTA